MVGGAAHAIHMIVEIKKALTENDWLATQCQECCGILGDPGDFGPQKPGVVVRSSRGVDDKGISLSWTCVKYPDGSAIVITFHGKKSYWIGCDCRRHNPLGQRGTFGRPNRVEHIS